ncbi:Mitochondrial import inner membrane translocase subunit Tim17-A [Perkinsus chesapeaki]|uniref:Mitochondrial import inner membrane translocase subunit Tim17-A n=1 Tax=Perkinsus chesapeaki TaxID=330153 RepID=A0A7J6MZ09_PERCH|nr:Mitochondrial import inner membrane translocase subunit Tim17-A [Perkinsus chesapeaki]
MTREVRDSDRDAAREPCPDRIVEDLGGAFGMGCVGGFLWHFVKGARNSPRGERLHGALYSAKTRAPILGTSFAVWGGTFSAFDCSLQYIRQRDDHWNAIASGFLTGGVLAARGGWKTASKNAVVGGILLAIIEGVSALLMKSSSQTPREQALMQMQQEKLVKEYQDKHNAAKKTAEAAAKDGSVLSGLGGLWGRKHEEVAGQEQQQSEGGSSPSSFSSEANLDASTASMYSFQPEPSTSS